MAEAAMFYEKAAAGLGDDFLDDVQVAIDSIRNHPELGSTVPHGCVEYCCVVFRSASSMLWRPRL